jgi:hypothetical protein
MAGVPSHGDSRASSTEVSLGIGRGQWPLPQVLGLLVGAGAARDSAVEGAWTGWIAAAPVAANGRSHTGSDAPVGAIEDRDRGDQCCRPPEA